MDAKVIPDRRAASAEESMLRQAHMCAPLCTAGPPERARGVSSMCERIAVVEDGTKRREYHRLRTPSAIPPAVPTQPTGGHQRTVRTAQRNAPACRGELNEGRRRSRSTRQQLLCTVRVLHTPYSLVATRKGRVISGSRSPVGGAAPRVFAEAADSQWSRRICACTGQLKIYIMSGPDKHTFRRSAVTILTNLAQGSAPFITTFLLIHLSAPALANLGGSSLSSQVMLLGREYYQTSLGERYLLFAPLLVHTGAAALKRLISPRPPRRATSPLAVTGYAAMLFLLPVHFATHRLYPSDPSPPISALGPSELDYEFVKAGLHAFPVRSALLYGALVLGVALHAADGLHILWTTWMPGTRDTFLALSRRTRRAVAGALAVPVLSGLFVLAQEPLLAFVSVADRYRAVFAQSFVYRF